MIIRLLLFLISPGIVFSYTMVQTGILLTIYMAVTFWRFYFPKHYAQYILHQVKFIHIGTFLLAYVYPLISAFSPAFSFALDIQQPFYHAQNVTFWSGGMGYQRVQFPPIFCAPVNYLIGYYFQVMPIVVIFPISGTLLLLILYHIWTVR